MEDSKKLAPVYLLRILRVHSGPDRPLSQKHIAELLQAEYDYELERKAVSRNLQLLANAFPGEVAPVFGSERKLKDGTVQQIVTGWYSCAEPLFDESELRYLADGIMASKSLKASHRRALLLKLAGLAQGEVSRELEGLGDVAVADANRAENPRLLYNVMLLSEAIRDGRRVSFTMGGYTLKGKIGKEPGTPERTRRYVVEPRALLMAGDRYYLVACYPKADKPYHFRVDMVFDLEFADPEEPAGDDDGSSAERRDQQAAFDPQRYRDQHALMFSGEPVSAQVLVEDTRYGRRILFDSFGTSARIVGHKGSMLVAKVKASRESVRLWGAQHADVAEVFEPEDLRDELRGYARQMLSRYALCDENEREGEDA